MNDDRIQHLASEIVKHKELYYNGSAILTDEEFDALEDNLRQLSPNHPVLQSVGKRDGSPDSQRKVIHSPKMLSLQKTYTTLDIFDFLTKYIQLVCMEKIDGMAICIEYSSQGELIRASTRGNGAVGEDITQHIWHVSSIPKSIPMSCFESNKDIVLNKVEIRGEIFFPLTKFEIHSQSFDSYRNAVAGTFGRKNVSDASNVLKDFQFGAYDLFVFDTSSNVIDSTYISKDLCENQSHYSNKLKMLKRLGFWGIPFESIFISSTKDLQSLEIFIQHFMNKERDYKIDGLVFRINDEKIWENLGYTAHHPRGSLAFKMQGEVGITKIVAIETNIGRTGKLTLRAKLEPIYLSGANITHASLHSAEFLEKGGYGVGALVTLKRSGEVIPSIMHKVSEPEKPYSLPNHCPCGYPLEKVGPHLFCQQTIICPEKDQESLVHFVKSLNTKGISEKTISLLWENGLVRQPADLFRITQRDLLELDRFAEKSATNFVNTIRGMKTIELYIFLTALGIHGFGLTKSRQVSRFFKSYQMFKKTIGGPLLLSDLFKGWNEKSSQTVKNSFQIKEPLAEACLEFIHVENTQSIITIKDFFENVRLPIFGTLKEQVPKALLQYLISQVNSVKDIISMRWEDVKHTDSKLSEKNWNSFLNLIEESSSTPPPDSQDSLNSYKDFLSLCVHEMQKNAQQLSLGNHPPDGPLTGLRICITGEVTGGRSQLAEKIRTFGGDFSNTIDKKTNYLISNSPSKSKKYMSALELGVKIISENEFFEILKDIKN